VKISIRTKIISLTVGMVVLAGTLSAGAALLHARQLINSYDRTVKTELEQKGLAYATPTTLFFKALGEQAFAVYSPDNRNVLANTNSEFENLLLNAELWVPDASKPAGYVLGDTLSFSDAEPPSKSDDITMDLVRTVGATEYGAAAVDEANRLIQVGVPVYLRGELAGIAVGTVSAEEEFQFFADKKAEAIRDSILTAVAVTVVVSLMGLVLSLVLSRAIVRPVRHLTALAERVSLGEVDVEVGRASNDEIGDLADSFARLVTAIRFLRLEAAGEEPAA
jgi:HAMP domain-containing protein